MDFLKMFLRGLTLLLSMIQGAETLYGAQTGAEKRAAVIEIVGSAINVVDACGSGTIVDSGKFTAALGVIVDGIVACLNASVWARA